MLRERPKGSWWPDVKAGATEGVDQQCPDIKVKKSNIPCPYNICISILISTKKGLYVPC